MHIIYTLDTTPHLNGRWGLKNGTEILEKTILMYALSISWINQWYSNITIVTDELGVKLLKGVAGEFELFEEKAPQDLWALNKINSIKNRVAPFVHIDGDFVFRKPINFRTKTLMCDRLETDNFHHHYTQWLSMFNAHTRDNTIKWWIPTEAWSPNCGIISVGNSVIMEDLIESIEYYKNIYLETKNTRPASFLIGKADPNCVIEQFGIRRACEKNNIEIEFLTSGVNEKEQRLHESKNDYFHYYGFLKYNDKIISEVKTELKTLFPTVHKNITSNIKKWKSTRK